MGLILRNDSFKKIRFSDYYGTIIPIKYQANVGLYGVSKNDFQLEMPMTRNPIPIGYYVTLGATEFGGRISARLTNYDKRTITYTGRTIRGQLEYLFANATSIATEAETELKTAGAMVQEMIAGTQLNGIYTVTESTSATGYKPAIPEKCNALKAFDLITGSFGAATEFSFADNGIAIKIKDPATHYLQAEKIGVEFCDDHSLPTGLFGFYKLNGVDGRKNAFLQTDGTIGTSIAYRGMNAVHVTADLGQVNSAEEAQAIAIDRLRALRQATYLGSIEDETINASIGDKVSIMATEYRLTVTQTVSEKVLTVQGERQTITSRTGG